MYSLSCKKVEVKDDMQDNKLKKCGKARAFLDKMQKKQDFTEKNTKSAQACALENAKWTALSSGP